MIKSLIKNDLFPSDLMLSNAVLKVLQTDFCVGLEVILTQIRLLEWELVLRCLICLWPCRLLFKMTGICDIYSDCQKAQR